MLKKIFYLLLFIYFIPAKNIFCQDVPFSQYYSNLVQLNPAFAGTRNENRLNVFYRNQWPRSGARFQSFGISYDMPLKKYNSGFGILATNDFAGYFSQPSFDLIYNYKFRIKKKFLISTSLQAGVNQKFLFSDLKFENESETISKGFNSFYPDFATGATLFYKNIYSGLSVDHISQPFQGSGKTNQEQLNRKYTLFVGYIHELKTRLINNQKIISPNVLIQMQGAQNNICWGSSLQLNEFVSGIWIRNNLNMQFDALIFMAGFRNQNWRLTYSYDINVGKKTTIPLGSHEISMVMLFKTQSKKRFKALSCPTFLL